MLAQLVALFFSVYIPVHIVAPDAVDCGHQSGSVASDAWDEAPATIWASSQTGSGISGVSCIGFNYVSPGPARVVTAPFHLIINQCNAANALTSVYVNYHVNGLGWLSNQGPYTITSGFNAIDDPSTGAVDGVRLLANSNLAGVARWNVCDMAIMMVQPDAYVAPTDTPTSTPTNTPTPTITPTPSNTPSPTPNYRVVITSTQGSPMYLERGATDGDLLIFAGLMAVFVMLVLIFAFMFWERRRNG